MGASGRGAKKEERERSQRVPITPQNDRAWRWEHPGVNMVSRRGAEAEQGNSHLVS